ncbi:MAG: leucine-rich repeat domain-containing protein [Clostridia bacterium]|nr:leucine-rich repeat domain-containing protein [Clostridia bacterium]
MKKTFAVISAAVLLLAFGGICKASDEDFIIENGVLTEYVGRDIYVKIPGEVDTIGDGAFRRNKNIVRVEIPGSVKEIGERAFKDCTSLKIVEGMGEIVGKSAFDGCISLEEIPQLSVAAEIHANAFEGCVKLPFFALGENLKEIGSYAFAGCTKLDSVFIPKNVEIIGSGAFMNCSGLKTVIFDAEKRHGIRLVGERAFYECRNLDSVNFPDSVEEIGPYAFFGSGIRLAHVGGDGNIQSYAFAACPGLESVTLSDTLSGVSDHAFAECTMLSRVKMSDYTIADPSAFEGCPLLETGGGGQQTGTVKPNLFPQWNPELAAAYEFMKNIHK